MRHLILSDIHSNWEALESVLEAAAGRYDRVICCGDVVGYGPDPGRVTERTKSLHCQIVRGNHDKAVLGQTDLSFSIRWPARRFTGRAKCWQLNTGSSCAKSPLVRLI